MTVYAFSDENAIVRLVGTLDPDPSGGEVPIGPAGGDLTGTYPDPTLDLTKTHVWTANQTAPALVSSGLTGSVAASRYVGAVATVAPTTGAHLVGDWCVSQAGTVFVCTAAGTPGTWVESGSTTFAPKASPTFTGTPAAPTAAGGTNTTQIATTAFVTGSFAPLASPTLTGTPLAPTAAKGTNTTQLATTAHVANILTSGAGVPGAGFVSPLYYDTTAVTGGLYAWNGAAYVHVSAVV